MILRRLTIFLAAGGLAVAVAGCSLFRKKDEDEGLRPWNADVEKPKGFAKWSKWEDEKSEEMWRKFRDG